MAPSSADQSSSFANRRLVAILFADIQGYTASMQKDEATTLRMLQKYQDSLGREVSLHNGEIVKNFGDGSLCLFPTALSAISCAKALQLDMLKGLHVPLRIGMHEGDVVSREGDVYGDAINLASRIESMGIAGNVLISKSLYQKVKNHPEFKFRSLGSFDFKNVDESLEVFALANEGLIVPEKKELIGKFKVSKSPIKRQLNWILPLIILALAAIAWYSISKADSNGKLDELQSIAVLPFDNLSGDSQQEYYAHGMQDELIGNLAKISGLRVISRTSTMKYQNAVMSISDIADELGVAMIVEGSLMKYGDSVRIQIQLIDAQEKEDHLWSRFYDRSAQNVLRMHSEVTMDIANSIQLALTPSEKSELVSSKQVDPKAYDALLRGKFHLFKFTPQDIQIALQYFQQALSTDPEYAEAYAMISATGGFMLVLGALPPKVAGHMMRTNAEKSLLLDPNLAGGHAALAMTETWSGWNWDKADVEWQKAIELDPNDATSRIYYGHYLACMGRFEEAKRQGQIALDLDPFNNFFKALYGALLLSSEDHYDEARNLFEEILEKDPYNPFPHYPLTGISAKQGNLEKAFKSFLTYNQMTGDTIMTMELSNTKEIKGGRQGFLRAAEVLIERRKYTQVRPHLIVVALDMAGETDRAVSWLDTCYVYRDHDMTYANQAPYSDEMKNHPEYKRLMQKMNFPRIEN